MEIRLAEKNRAAVLQTPHDFSVFRGNPVFEQLARRGGPDAHRVDVVLQRDRNAVEGSSPHPPLLLRLHLARGCQSLLPRDCDERIQGGVVTVNSLEAGLREIDWRCGSASQKFRRFLDRQAGQILRFSNYWFQSQADGHANAGGKKGSAIVRIWLHVD